MNGAKKLWLGVSIILILVLINNSNVRWDLEFVTTLKYQSAAEFIIALFLAIIYGFLFIIQLWGLSILLGNKTGGYNSVSIYKEAYKSLLQVDTFTKGCALLSVGIWIALLLKLIYYIITQINIWANKHL